MVDNRPNVIYLDNAATSFPKAPPVTGAIVDFLSYAAGNPGRSGHALALAAQRTVSQARRLLAELFGAPDPSRIVFAHNTTDALNTALWGLLRPGDRVVTTAMEHNAVIRPLHELAERGVSLTMVPCSPTGSLDPDDLGKALQAAPTRLVAMTHASNVTGTLMPVREAVQLAHAHGALFLLDAAQTAGVLPIDVTEMELDLMAFPGHKGLLGPTGTGGLYVSPHVQLWPSRQGGTGTRSDQERQPHELPEALESGTVNTVGIAGLAAAVRYLKERGLPSVLQHEMCLTERLLQGLREIRGLQVHGPADCRLQVATVSVTLEGWEPVDLAAVLDSAFCIAVRPGLHCAPVAHRTIGTYPQGTVRLSAGCFSSQEDVQAAIAALSTLSGTAT